MKEIIPLLAAAVVLASAFDAHAQADMIIKQKARALNGAPPPATAPAAKPPATPAPGPTPSPSPAAPTLTPEQMQLVDKLAADLTGIKAGSIITPEQKEMLQNDAATLAKGAIKPSKESLAKLSASLSAALAGKDVTPRDQSLSAKAIYAVLNSGTLTAAQAQNAVNVVQNTLKSSNASEADVKAVTGDLRAIVADLQKSKPKLYQ